MKIKLGNLKRLIREASQDVLGKYAWPQDREDNKEEPQLPYEKDTPVERKLRDSILNYISGERTMSQTDAQSLQDLLTKSSYSDIIHEPSPSTDFVYRGIALGVTQMRDLIQASETGAFGIPFRNQAQVIPDTGFLEDVARTLKSPGGDDSKLSSWTTDPGIAKKFSKHFSRVLGDDKYFVILGAKVSENPNTFIAGPNGFYKLKDTKRFQNEKEVFAVGPVKIQTIEWIKK